MKETSRPHALDGLKVVSMAEQYPGPFCTLILSDMGADVIQVERPDGGDPTRFHKTFYENLNRNKRSVALDGRKAEDKAQILELIKQADVFIEGFRPGKLAKLGLGYDDLAAVNDRLIYASVSGFGQTGPYKSRPGHDITFQGHGGALDERVRGVVSGLAPATLLGDSVSALYLVIAILGALTGRTTTGKGTYIDVAMSDAVLSLQTPFVGQEDGTATPPPQADPGYGLYQTSDGKWLTTSIAHEDDYWNSLCRDVGLDEYIGLNRDDRIAMRNKLVSLIAARINAEPFAHWEALFEASGQMWGPALSLPELQDDAQFRERGLFEEVTRYDGVSQSMLRLPIKFSTYDNVATRRAPLLGEHQGETFMQKS